MSAFLIRLIKLYQFKISSKTPPRCRFFPTCSCYAIEAISKFGAAKGLALSVFRILRCTPLFPGGYDPVPEKKDF